jgi:hypothetical protein
MLITLAGFFIRKLKTSVEWFFTFMKNSYLASTGLNFELNKRGSSIIKYISFHLVSHLEGVRL